MGKRASFHELHTRNRKKYPEAIALYQKNGFTISENYGQYIGIEDSICFQKYKKKALLH
jgi:ribosomal protein S18 acetylase RimI-like enzyme